MSDNMTGPEMFESSQAHLRDIVDPPAPNMDAHLYAQVAQVHAINALTAAVLLLVDTVADGQMREMEAWRKVIPRPHQKD